MSQYKDQIDPNNVIFNVIHINDKLYSSVPTVSSVDINSTFTTESGGKFYDKYYRFTQTSRDVLHIVLKLKEYINLNKFTVSYWARDTQTGSTNSAINIVNYLTGDGVCFTFSRQGKVDITVMKSWSWGTHRAGSSIPLNSWFHIGGTYDNGTAKIYLNGTLAVTNTDLSSISNTNSIIIQHFRYTTLYSAIEDFTIIKDQILWTSNFDPPNNLLLGNPSLPKKFSNKHMIYPILTDRNDYFDKAFIY